MLRLRGVLAVKAIAVKDCATLLGIAEKTMHNKLSGRTDFTYGEIRKLKMLLPEYDVDYLMSRESA